MEILILILLLLYFIPGIVAGKRKHRNKNAIFTLNALTGWTGIGWVIAMVWAMTNNIFVDHKNESE